MAVVVSIENGPSAQRKSAANSAVEAAKSRCNSNCLVWTAALLVWVFIIYHVATPSGTVERHSKALDEKLMSLSTSIAEQRASISSQINEITARLRTQKEALVEEETAGSSPGGSETVVSEEHEKLKAEHDKLKGEHEKLKEHHESEVAEMQKKIQASEEQLAKKKKELGEITVDPAKFCNDCIFDHGGLRTTCGKRKAYLMSRHGDTEEVATEAVVKMDPNCVKS